MGDKDKGKKNAGFNTPFAKLKVEQKKAPAISLKKVALPPPKQAVPLEKDDEAMFRAAMFGVAQLPDQRGVAPPPRPVDPVIVSDEAEAMARLAELVSGEAGFDIADTDEYIEGGGSGLDPRIVASLRRGEYAVQGHIDLHAMTQADAKDAVEKFLTQSRKEGKRCVLIVHGRGLHSKDQIPVLKERLKVWLHRGRIGRTVMAFATARPHDGGAGAVYVLLRR